MLTTRQVGKVDGRSRQAVDQELRSALQSFCSAWFWETHESITPAQAAALLEWTGWEDKARASTARRNQSDPGRIRRPGP